MRKNVQIKSKKKQQQQQSREKLLHFVNQVQLKTKVKLNSISFLVRCDSILTLICNKRSYHVALI